MTKTTGFTLLELLIVIGILAILATVTFVVLNPAELLKQTRDSRRVQDLSTLNKAVELVHISNTNLSLGSSSIVYVSLADTSSNCSNLSLPSLPIGWSYKCVTQTNLRKVDGQGWIPINFASSSFGSPLAILPIDPINNASSSLYYTYVTGGSWELTALLESSDRHTAAINDGGTSVGVFEIGTATGLTPATRDMGLVGYWKFDNNFNDSSGNNNNGTQSGGVYFTTGKQAQAGSFDGSDDYVSVLNSANLNPSMITIIMWLQPTNYGDLPSNYREPLRKENSYHVSLNTSGDAWNIGIKDPGDGAHQVVFPQNDIPLNTWTHLALTFNGSTLIIYRDAATHATLSWTGNIGSSSNNLYIGEYGGLSRWYSGFIDELRIYNRALSATEIKALYDATK